MVRCFADFTDRAFDSRSGEMAEMELLLFQKTEYLSGKL